jgi:hypothetical protein
MLVGHFTATETQGHLDLVALVEEALHRPHLHVIVVIVDGRAHLDLLDLDDLLFLAGLGSLLLLLVFVLAVVHQLADGRLGVGRDFDDVESFFLAQCERLIQADLAILMAIVADQEDGFGIDLVVDARAILGRRWGITLKTSGNYDSLLCTAARIRVSPGPLKSQAKRGSVMDASGGLSWVRRVGAPAVFCRIRR